LIETRASGIGAGGAVEAQRVGVGGTADLQPSRSHTAQDSCRQWQRRKGTLCASIRDCAIGSVVGLDRQKSEVANCSDDHRYEQPDQ
jgi:hypothetical protein